MSERMPRRDVTDPEALRAFAHPLRQRMFHHLAFTGPATATGLARKFEQNTGMTSYHLRQLARYGFIEEAPRRSGRRERWWRAVTHDLRFPSELEAPEEARASARELGRVSFERDGELLASYLRERERFGDWDKAAMFSSSSRRFTKEELELFTEEYIELLKRHWRPPEQSPPEARPVAIVFYAFRWPGE